MKMVNAGISSKPTYKLLEERWSEFVGSEYSVSCNSGTSALHLGLLALGVGEGDEVIVPDFTMAACAFAVSYCGARPVFVDVDVNNYSIIPSEIERSITPKTKAIMVVHVYGRLAPMEEILKIARKHSLPVIEDACEAQGAVYQSRADISVYSFYKNKIICAEEGGMLCTDIKEYAETANLLKNMAFTPEHDYTHNKIGFNYRMPESQAWLALESLGQYDRNATKRRLIEGWYDRILGGSKARDAVWFYEYFNGEDKSILRGLPTARHSFKPLSSLPMYGGVGMENSTFISKNFILLPCDPSVTREEVETIAHKVFI